MTDVLRAHRAKLSSCTKRAGKSKANQQLPMARTAKSNGAEGAYGGISVVKANGPSLPAARVACGGEHLNQRELWGAAYGIKKRGTSRCACPWGWDGLDGKLADTFNEVIELNQRMSLMELERLEPGGG